MGASVWRDEQGLLRCQRSPGGTEWYVRIRRGGVFELWETVEVRTPRDRESAGEERGRVDVGRIDPETAEQIIKFLVREQRSLEAVGKPEGVEGAPGEPAALVEQEE